MKLFCSYFHNADQFMQMSSIKWEVENNDLASNLLT